MSARLFAIASSVLISIIVLELIRREKMTFKYSLLWLITCSVVLVLAIFDGLLNPIAQAAGFVLTSNFVFFLLLVFIVFLCIFLTIYINEQNTRTETLAQTLAILEYRLDQLKKKK